MKATINYRRKRLYRAERSCRKFVVMISVIFIYASMAWANPRDGQVVSGSVQFSNQGNTLNITNSPNSIINWKSFSIGANETTRFIQPNSASSVLNRIYGQDPSLILGTLQSNGRVLLINPNGVVFGKGSRVDVNGLIASTLNISNQDFLSEKYQFNAGSITGAIQNQGTIATPSGGMVYLIAPDIENSGIINTPQGKVILAAGHSVQLFDSLDPDISVVVSAPADRAVNLGQIIAQSGKVGIYGGLISQQGTVNADRAIVGENGKIFFKATKDVTLVPGSTTRANGDQGGQIKIQSESGTTLVSGTVSAAGDKGKGGEIQVLGNQVGLTDNALIDASGKTGGGTILIGGDYQGKNPDVQNATAAYIGQDAVIKADALSAGDGGKVIVWSDEATRVYGSIFAQGGVNGGDGGFVETSGGYLDVNGISVTTLAPYGENGTWLLDPSDIIITSTGTGVLSGGFYDPTTPTGTISWSTIETGLASGNVTIQTTSGFGGNGDIIADNGYNFINAGAGVLTLNADRDITFNTLGIPISGNPLGLTLQAGRNVAINNGIFLNIPNPININAVGDVVVNDIINAYTIGASGANIAISSTGGITGNAVNLMATTGYISMNNAAPPAQAQTLTLNAMTGIYGSSSADPLRTSNSGFSTTINASNSGAGPINISDASYDGLIIGTSGVIQSGAGQPIDLYSAPSMFGGIIINGPITNNSGDIFLTVGKQDYLLTINNSVMATGGNVTYISDNIAVNATTTSSASAGANVHIYPFTGTTNIEFSPVTDAAGYLRLSSAELDYFTTPLLKVGQNIVTGNISIMEPVAPTYPYFLSLITSGAISQTSGSTITVANLNADGWTGVTLNEANDVDNLGGHSDTGNCSFTDVDGINVGFVDVNNGINISTSGNIILTAGANVTQSSGSMLITPPTGSLSVDAETGIALTEPNVVPNVILSNAISGDVTYITSIPALFVAATNAAAGNIYIANNTGAINVNNVATGTGNITLSGSGNVNLAGTVLSSGNINVVTGASFINSFGAGAFPGSGPWLVWSVNPASDTRGGLTYDFKQYAATYGTTTVLGTGNGFMYSIAPVLNAGLTGTVTKTYDATTNATLAAGNYIVSGAIDGDTIALSNPTTGFYDNKNIGTGKNVTVNGMIATATNGAVPVYGYTVNNSASAAIGSITPATLTISGAVVQNKIYDAATAATITGETLIGVLGSDVVTVNGDGTFANANAGAAKPVAAALTLSGIDSGNYILSQPTGLAANITPAALTVTANDYTKTYDGLAYSGGNDVVYSGFVGSETPTVLGGALTYGGTSQGAINAGGYIITPGGLTANNGNYNITYIPGDLTINPAALSIIADDKTKYAGDPNPTLTATYSGFVSGENQSVLGGSLSLATTAILSSPAGDYPIIPSGITSNNYQISFLNGNLKVDPVLIPLALPQSNVLYVTMLNSNGTVTSTFTVAGGGCGGSSDSDTDDDSQSQKDGQGGGNKNQALPYCN